MSRPEAAPRPLRILYLGWRRDEWRTLLRTSSRVQPVEIDLRIREGGWFEPGRRFLSAIKRAGELAPDLILAESIGVEGLAGLLLRKLTGAPLAVRLKGDPWAEAEERAVAGRPAHRLSRRLNFFSASKILESADGVFPIAPHLSAIAGGKIRDDAFVKVVPNACLSPKGGEAPPVTGETFLLSVTNFHYRKKIEPLLRCIPLLAPLLEELDLEWTILGDGQHFEESRKRFARFERRVRLAGWRESLPFYRQNPIVLYLSGLDGLPSALLEAAGAGLAIIVNRGSPAEGFVQNETTGLVVDLDDPVALPAALRRLVCDAALRKRLGRAASLRVRENFSEKAVRTQIESALEGFLAFRRP